MQNKQKIIFFGGGNMARAIFNKLTNDSAFEIEVIQRNPDKRALLSTDFSNIKIRETLDYQPQANDIVVIAIKPQHAAEALATIHLQLTKCMIISIMAGLSIKILQQWINNKKIIRIMPNTPASVEQGVSAIYYPDIITNQERKLINQIFSNIGIIYLAQNEDEIDKIVPVTSSAVAFVYYFMEGMINSAINQFGFNEKTAKELISQVISGSIALVRNNPQISITELRTQVTSKKGTTEQGILTFEQSQFHSIINDAMLNSYQRGLEIAREFE